MPARFTATANAFEKGIDSVSPGAAVKLIESWEESLKEVDAPGAKGIASDLAALRKQLESESPDGEKVKSLVEKLGAATTKIAAKADKPATQPKLEELGAALSNAA